jgi:hypothetical protein
MPISFPDIRIKIIIYHRFLSEVNNHPVLKFLNVHNTAMDEK